jgi:hypothetical protein
LIDRPLIVLSLEGLATSALGCYGSSWNSTPAIDAIAGSGCVWDRWIASSDDPLATLRDAAQPTGDPWKRAWSDRGQVELLSDVPLPADIVHHACFDRIETLPHDLATTDDLPAADIADSQLGRLIAAAIERDSRDEPWSVLWLHSGFLVRRWDAPRDLFPPEEADEHAGEPSEEVELLEVESERRDETPCPPPMFSSVIPPQLVLTTDTHPDLIMSWKRTYGCQIRLLDLLLEVLVEALSRHDPCVMLLGTSGFRLGQGGCVGHRPARLRSPDIHLPLLVSDHGPLRIPHLTSSSSLAGWLETIGRSGNSLLDPNTWSEPDPTPRIETRSDRAQLALTTPGWFYVRDADASEHLFLKPDDIDDFNDVARRGDDVISQLRE